jgi:hypothetical protein
MDDYEFSFWNLDEREFSVCRDYEFGREHEFARKEAIGELSKGRDPGKYTVVFPDLKHLVLTIRQNWSVEKMEPMFSEQTPRWFQSPESRVLVLYPEWPNLPYLRISKENRLRRISKFFPDANKTNDLGSRLSEIQRDLRKNDKDLRKSEKENDRATQKFLIEQKGALLKQLAEIASLVQPNWQGPKSIRKIAIPSNTEGPSTIYQEDVVTAFRVWLSINFPELPKNKDRGRASEAARIVDDLNALAVHRLRRSGKKLSAIVDLVRSPGSGPNGSKSYRSDKQLDPPAASPP